MKNLVQHYFAIIIPAILLMVFWKLLIPEVALILLFLYGFIYRTWLDGNRLFLKGMISKRDIWKVSYNGSRINYFKALYLQR